MSKYRLLLTSRENFEVDRRRNFDIEGFNERWKKTVESVKQGDKFIYYIKGSRRVAAITEAISEPFYDDKTRIWVEKDEIWPYRFKTRPLLVLEDDEWLDIKGLISQLNFITPKQKATSWAIAFHLSLKEIPQEDFELIESEMRKRKAVPSFSKSDLTEDKAKQAIMVEPNLESKSLHDRIGEMLEIVGSKMGFNSFTRHKVTPEHAVELDVAWLQGKNPEVAIEIQIGGNIVEAKDKLTQARKFNYRKVIMVIEESQLPRLNAIVKFDELIDWMDAWSIPAVYRLYSTGVSFLGLYERLIESRYKKKSEVEFVKE